MRGNILIVDDELGPRESLRMILKAEHDVRTASSGEEALAEVERQKPDLVFLDLRMPGMSGTKVLEAIKAKHPDVEVAIITAYAAVESARIAVQCGALDYLIKPYSVSDVERIVDRALRSRRQQHDAEMLMGQLGKLTEAIAWRARALADAPEASSLTNALDRLQLFQTAITEDLDSLRELSELGEVAAEVTHDINNLLTIILTSAQFLISHIDSHPSTDLQTVVARLGSIVQAAEDCSAMVKRVRDFTRTQGALLETTELDINELVSGTVALKREETTAKGLDVELRTVLRPVPLVRGDEVSLRNVLMNLLENALDAVAGHGVIEVRTEVRENVVRIEVADNGCGMSPEVASKATRAFFSTKQVRGTGLGLSIADKVVRQHNGRMTLDSEEGRGTTVTIELPTVGEVKPLAEARRDSGTVLLIEDEPAMRSLMAAILEAEGYRVLQASDGLEGWTAFEEFQGEAEGRPLVVVTDHELPGMTGRELASRIKTLDASRPVMIVSGYIHGGEGPEDMLMSKPFDLDEFTSRVRSLIERAASSVS